jgi:ankyrin repeat protein
MLRIMVFLTEVLLSVVILTFNFIARWRHFFWLRKTPAKPRNPFTTAVLENDVATVRASLDSGLDPNTRLPDTPKLDLTEGGRKEAPAELRAYAPTALMVAAMHGYTELAQILLDFGADVDLTKGTETALHYAAYGGHRETVVLLLGGRDKENIHGTHFETALVSAARSGHETVVALLLEHGADVDIQNDFETPLIAAAACGHVAVVALLLKHGADVNRKAGDGETPLMGAAAGNHPEIVSALIAVGADLDARDDEGRTALWWAKRPEARAVLRKAGAKK